MQTARAESAFTKRRQTATTPRSHRRPRTGTVPQRRRGPQTRSEVEGVISRSPRSPVTEATRYWFALEDERASLETQKRRVRELLQDRLLEAVLSERIKVLDDALYRRAGEICGLPAREVADICCKCYLRQRIVTHWPQDSVLRDAIYAAIRSDLARLGVKVEAAAA